MALEFNSLEFHMGGKNNMYNLIFMWTFFSKIKFPFGQMILQNKIISN
jgi:hypothetical protein